MEDLISKNYNNVLYMMSLYVLLMQIMLLMSTRIGELNSLHIATYMDIEKTTQSMNNILAYKKELAPTMLKCSDEEQMKILTIAIKHSYDMICKVLCINMVF